MSNEPMILTKEDAAELIEVIRCHTDPDEAEKALMEKLGDIAVGLSIVIPATKEMAPLPSPVLLFRWMPDYYRHGEVYGYTKAQMVDYAKQCIATEYAELLADKARLDFLENRESVYWVEVLRQPQGHCIFRDSGPGLRQAIDNCRAAIAAKEQEEGK